MRLGDPAGSKLRLVVVMVLVAALSGCAYLPWRKNAANAAATKPEPLREIYRLRVNAPDALKPLLTSFLDLGRFQRAPESDRITATELERLIAAAPLQARGLLETEGYFNAEVEARRLPVDVDGLPVVQVDVRPGVRAQVTTVELEAAGPLQKAAEAKDPAAQRSLAEMRARWPLQPGRPFRQGAWSDAKNSALTNLHANGYPAAGWSDTSAQVDAATNSARLYALVDSGPLFHLGEIRVEGLERYQASAARNLATFRPGSRYSEKALLDTQDRLARSGLFEGAVVEIDPDPATAAAAPVVIRVKELQLQQATVGVGFSDATGQRITFEHTHRKVFGRSFFGTDWIAKNKFEFGRDQQSWQGDLTTHPLAGGWRNFLGGNLLREDAVGTLVRSGRIRAGRSLETERVDRLLFAEFQQALTRSDVLTESSRALSANVNLIFRKVDSVLLPSDGVTASAETAAGFAWSAAPAENGPFARLLGRVTLYRPLGNKWFGTARVQAGQVFTKDSVGIPDTLLFRAGGDDSVRGYAYRSLGPVVSGVVTSGRVLLTASGEVARPISDSFPAFWWALFADAGNAADSWGDIKPVFGYGAGLRWRSPVGPLRLDLAYADELRKTRLHLSVGIAF